MNNEFESFLQRRSATRRKWLLRVGTLCGIAPAILIAAPAFAQCEPQLEAEIAAEERMDGDSFGIAVGIWGDVAVVGADLADLAGSDSGAAYVFRRTESGWVEEQALVPDDGAPGDSFGVAVSVAGELAVVGAWSDNDNGEESGSAYVFRYDGETWQQEAKLVPDDGEPGDSFGISVAVRGDTIVIGADLTDDKGLDSGAAYVFRNDGNRWEQKAKLLAKDGDAQDSFGTSVAVSADLVLIGAWLDSDQNPFAGSAYVFRYDGTSWQQEAKLLADDGEEGDSFGISVAVAGNAAVIGADLDDERGLDSGSAYVFRFDGEAWIQEALLLADDGSDGDLFGASVSLSDGFALVGAWGDGDRGKSAGSAYLFRDEGGTWVSAAKLLANDGAAGDSFGISVSLSELTGLVGADLHVHEKVESGAAYVFDFSDCDVCIRDPEWICDGDVDGDGQVNPVDSGLVQSAFCLPAFCTDAALCSYDLDCDGQVNPVDAGIVQALFGICDPPRDPCP